MPQIRNDQMEGLLGGAFTTRKEFVQDGARLLSAVKATHRANDGGVWGGGQLVEGFMADSVQANGMAATAGVWTTLNLGIAGWLSTNRGGPYAMFTNSALYIPDAAWQESGSANLFVWKWVLTGSTASSQTIESKYDTNGNQCSWRLWLNSAGPAFSFTANAGGAPGGDVVVASSHAVVTSKWYFVAAFFLWSTLMRIFVAQSTDDVLRITNLSIGVPASLFNSSAPLTIGSSWNNAGALTQLNPWGGYIGVGNLRFNTPSGASPYAAPTAYATRLFQMTKWFYEV
jgi:hypothetical protein